MTDRFVDNIVKLIEFFSRLFNCFKAPDYESITNEFDDEDQQEIDAQIDVIDSNSDILEKLLKKLEKESNEKRQEVKAQLTNGNRSKAASLLKEKKNIDARILQYSNILQTLDQSKTNLIDHVNVTEIGTVLRGVSDTIGKLNRKSSISSVDKTMDDLRNHMVNGQEIMNSMSEDISATIHDDDEIEDELLELENEDVRQELTNLKIIKPTPIIIQSNNKPSGGSNGVLIEDDEEELKKFESELV